MAEPKLLSETSLQLERSIPAPPEAVYAAWLEAETLKRWFAPSDDFETVIHRADGKVGGEFKLEMRKPDGSVHIAHGTYKELVPAKRIVFTWTWDNHPEDGNSLISVDLAPEGKGTKLVFTHEQLPTAKSRDNHAKGWTGCLDRLVRAIGR